MPKRSPRRNLALLAAAGLMLLVAAGLVHRSPQARQAAAELVSPVAQWWAPPERAETRAETRAEKLERRLAERVPRPERAPHPRRPRVALMDFRVDRDTWVGAGTARRISDVARAALDAEERFEWVDREALNAAAGEAALGLTLGGGDASSSVQLGAWLGCDLIVTGTFVDTGLDAQRLRLEVVDLLTADRVAETELPWPADLSRPEALPDADLDRLLEATRGLIGSAHERLASLDGAPVLSLLFFRNASGTDRLDHLEATMPERLEAEAREDPGVRLVRVTRAADAGDEQTLALNGLTQRDPMAWVRAADHYLWGYAAESADAAPDPGGGTIAMDPALVPTTVTLNLWSGVDAPETFTRTVPGGEVDAAVAELAEEVWAAAKAPVPDEVSPAQRDAVVALLTRGPAAESLQAGAGAAAGGRSRRISSNSGPSVRLAWQAASFFDPEDPELADAAMLMLPPLQPGRRWVGLGRRQAEVDRVIARHGAAVLGLTWTLREKLMGLEARAELHRGVTYRQHTLLGPGRSELPRDMPAAARDAYRQETLDGLIGLGRLLSGGPPASEHPGRLRAVDPGDVLSRDFRLSDAETAAVWSAWWPVFEPAWEEERLDTHRFTFDPDLLDRLSEAFASAGRSAEHEAMFAADPPAGEAQPQAARLTAAAAEHLRAWIDARVADGTLRPEPAASPEPVADPPASSAASSPPARSSFPSMPPGLPPDVRARFEERDRLRRARYGDDPAATPGLPRHVEEPAVAGADAVAEVSRLELTWDVSPGRELTLDRRGHTPQVRRVVPWRGRYAGLRAPHHRSPDSPAPPEGLGLLDPLTLRVAPLHERVGDAQWTDLAASERRLWLATAGDGLKLMLPWGEEAWRLGPEDRLVSGDVRRVAFDGTRVWVLSGDGRLGLVENPDGGLENLRLLDARLEERFSGARLEAAGGRAAMGGGGGRKTPWSWVGTDGVEPLDAWLASRTPHGDQAVVDVQAEGDAFWVVLETRLLQVSGAGEVLRDLPLHAPPLETLRIRGDGGLVWMAYAWEDPDPPTRDARVVGPPPERFLTRLLAVDAESGGVLGQTEWTGRLTDFFVAHDEVHLFVPDPERDVVMLRRDGLLAAMGVEDPGGATASSKPLPFGVPLEAWAAYRGELPPAGTPSLAEPDAWPPLLAAVRSGRAGTVARLLAAGADPDAATYGRFSHNAALLAVLMDRPDLLELLHEAGASLDATHAAVGTLGHAAVLADASRCIAWLGANGCDLDAYARIAPPAIHQEDGFDAFRCAPLHLAIRRGRLACVRALLDAGASVRDDRLQADRMFPLTLALSRRDDAIANLLLDRGADPRLSDAGRFTALETAVSLAEAQTVHRLLDAGADAARPGVLESAVDRGDPEILARVLDAGADPFATSGYDPDHAFRGWGVPALEALRDRRLDLFGLMSPPGDPRLDRPLAGAWRLGDFAATLALDRGFRGLAVGLVARGFSVDVPDREGLTLLAEAASRARPGRNEDASAAQVALLLALGTDPAATDDRGRSALVLAGSEAVRALLRDPAAAVARLRGTSP
ncbi:ankyrin repeat domain-containing protein [Phycisphaera mikurensis]|uniref:Ankyrin repeat-containing protein n=1 Tax=Phycisphaera mikurensis (strain NBRC 102666 / KCTC 22515 / FYK2301M01) TaxID=1142394 RepID=I0IHA7_PHYMF|nr:ankyrin repeat domain-containing protein [Phycisphaera mikurensis]MBB6440894.1 ankyrin repeat protein [Phycisphaera mikurensis]BAM04645.1 hypothetical protein PSMK_24860 [Phycisphaera mikurensis NBRC 102666]